MRIKKLPSEWCEIKNIQVLDPDGWHDKSWNDSIFEEEFEERCNSSTIRRLNPKVISSSNEEQTKILDRVENNSLILCQSLSDSPKSLKEHLCRNHGWLLGYWDAMGWEHTLRFCQVEDWLTVKIGKL